MFDSLVIAAGPLLAEGGGIINTGINLSNSLKQLAAAVIALLALGGAIAILMKMKFTIAAWILAAAVAGFGGWLAADQGGWFKEQTEDTLNNATSVVQVVDADDGYFRV